MKELIIVGCGGFFGSMSRHYLGGLVLHWTGASKFPYSTLAVNILGCFLVGLLGAIAEHFHLFTPPLRLLIFTGILGGFTTFSAFGYETLFLYRTGAAGQAVLNVLLQVILCLASVSLGHWLITLIAARTNS